MDKQVIDTHTHTDTQTDAGNDNTRRPKLASGKQGKSEGFDSCDRPSNLKLDSNRQFFRPCDHEIWLMTLQNNRAPLLCYFKLCASFRTHWWIQTWVTVWKRSIRVKIDNFFRCVTYKFYGWPCKTIGHLFYATSSFVHHIVAIGEFKLELQSGNAQSGSNLTIFGAVRPWNLTDDFQQGKSEGFDSCDRPSNLKLDSNRQFFRPCDREIWRMTLQYNRAPLLCYFKLCASFCSHWWIQTSITVRKRPIWVKFDDF